MIKEMILHEEAWKGCIALVDVGESMVIEYYSCVRMQVHTHGEKDSDSSSVEAIMSVSLKEFQTCRVQISDDVKNSDGISHYNWMVSAKLNALRIFSNLPHLNGGKTLRTLRDRNA